MVDILIYWDNKSEMPHLNRPMRSYWSVETPNTDVGSEVLRALEYIHASINMHNGIVVCKRGEV